MTLTPWIILSLLLLGNAIGMVSGVIGLGGGTMVIPALIYLYGFSQKQANGTSLAMMLPPIGIFAVLAYHKGHNVNWPSAMLLAAGFASGAYIGAVLVNTGKVPDIALRFVFAGLLLYVAGRMLFRTDGRAMAALQTCLLIGGFFGLYTVMRMLGRRWSKMPYWPSVYQERRKLPVVHDYDI
jgi:uncharacterized membrane protein YfcA